MSGKIDAISKESERNLAVKRLAGSDDDNNGDAAHFEPKKKISFGLVKPAPKVLDQGYNPLNKKSSLGISFKKTNMIQKSGKLGEGVLTKPKATGKAALAFNQDDEDEDDEEMPPEAKMRMKNIGRDTPTSSGPNSFGKGKMGFCDSKKIFERQLREKADGSAPTDS